jgi:hypothetical protein
LFCCLWPGTKKYTVNPGEKLIEKIPVTDIYNYEGFPLAEISFRDGRHAHARVNYNALFGEMQFIGPAGDTISVADEKDILVISPEKDSFYFFEGWLEQVASVKELKLLKKRTIEVLNKEKIGGMDVPGFGAIETNTKYHGSQNVKDLVSKERLTYAEYNKWFFGDRFNHFFPATKKSLLKIYNENEKQMSKYIDENKINFYREEDLLKLMKFIEVIK